VKWTKVFPPAEWLVAYRADWLRHDITAGVTLAAYAIPVSLAYAALAGLPPRATYRDWHRAIRRVLPSQQYPQTPNLYGSTSMKRWKVLG
jgi:hypothetical protein